MGIPKYRLPRNLDEEIKQIENMGVVIRTNVKVNSLESLFQEGYDAILVAVGAHQGKSTYSWS